jgi:hypothetical protein
VSAWLTILDQRGSPNPAMSRSMKAFSTKPREIAFADWCFYIWSRSGPSIIFLLRMAYRIYTMPPSFATTRERSSQSTASFILSGTRWCSFCRGAAAKTSANGLSTDRLSFSSAAIVASSDSQYVGRIRPILKQLLFKLRVLMTPLYRSHIR